MSENAQLNGLCDRFRGFYPVVIDVETAGFNAKTDALLEIAAITLKMDEHGWLMPDETLHFHVEPFEGANLQPEALAFNGINPHDPQRGAVSEYDALHAIFKMVRKGYKKRCKPEASKANLTIADAHKVRVQKAQSTAMNKLMGQLGKPYRWGGTSPRTGFDCSGLVYYAYKDLVKIHIPRTANEMYHLRDARPVDRDELQSGDLVFFRTRGRGAADHVGVYVGNGKFIQSPRTGRDIQITSLSEDYWVRHYVGARRVMTPKTIR